MSETVINKANKISNNILKYNISLLDANKHVDTARWIYAFCTELSPYWNFCLFVIIRHLFYVLPNLVSLFMTCVPPFQYSAMACCTCSLIVSFFCLYMRLCSLLVHSFIFAVYLHSTCTK